MKTSHEDQLKRSLERYGEALSAGDLSGISGCWEIPALVLSDGGTIPVSSRDEIEGFFAQAIEFYRAQGLVMTRPQLEGTVRLSETLTSVDVRWVAFDQSGREASSERSHYILRLGDDGQQRIQVALTITLQSG
ncbi:MAG: hypothetical protein M3252_01520 [Actinomycetota bacterium]|nr:hypothetical protein [Actinomycetota bacterium]